MSSLFPSMCALAGLVLAQTSPPAATTFRLSVSIALDDARKRLADAGWLALEIDTAEGLFEPFGVRFARTDGAPLDARLARVETRADRNLLASHITPGVIDVFIVGSLRDVDDLAQKRRGVHWHAPSGAHYLIMVASAPTTVLAHELGHYFGNPHSHWVSGDTVMQMPSAGGAPITIWSGGASPNAVAVDSSRVYWTTSTSIMSAPIGGGTATTVASASPPSEWSGLLAVSRKYICWVDENAAGAMSVMSLAKP